MGAFMEWFAGLDPAFVFLAVLPFVVGIFGLLAERAGRANRAAAEQSAPRQSDASAPQASEAQTSGAPPYSGKDGGGNESQLKTTGA